jgi:hypothetical protein
MEHVPCEHCQDPPRGVEGPREARSFCGCEQRAEVWKHSTFHINFVKKQHEMRHPGAAAVLFATNTHNPLPSCPVAKQTKFYVASQRKLMRLICDEKWKSFDAK